MPGIACFRYLAVPEGFKAVSSTEPALQVAGAVATATAAPQRLMGRHNPPKQRLSIAKSLACGQDEMPHDDRDAIIDTLPARVLAGQQDSNHKLPLQRKARPRKQDSLPVLGGLPFRLHVEAQRHRASRGPPASALAHRLAVMCRAQARWPQEPHRHDI